MQDACVLAALTAALSEDHGNQKTPPSSVLSWKAVCGVSVSITLLLLALVCVLNMPLPGSLTSFS